MPNGRRFVYMGVGFTCRWEISTMAKPIKPGTPAPFSGQYGLVGPRGGVINHEITATQGKPLPPTPKPGQSYVLTDGTNNASGGKK